MAEDNNKVTTENKPKQLWHMACAHWYIGGFALPLAIAIIAVMITVAAGWMPDELPTTAGQFIGLLAVGVVFYVVTFTISTYTSAKIINKRYSVKDSDQLSKLATIYTLITGAAVTILVTWWVALLTDRVADAESVSDKLALLSNSDPADLIMYAAGDAGAFFLVGAAVFYFLSHKLIKSSGDQLKDIQEEDSSADDDKNEDLLDSNEEE
ncbi:MAG: hypothetical protein WD061_00800 [Candidatus Saccharimonadales bacterium]